MKNGAISIIIAVITLSVLPGCTQFTQVNRTIAKDSPVLSEAYAATRDIENFYNKGATV